MSKRYVKTKPYVQSDVPNVDGNFTNAFMTNPDSYVYVPFDEPRLGSFTPKYNDLNAEEVNEHKYDEYNYDKNFKLKYNEPLSVIHEPNMKYTKRSNYLSINSKDRDYVQYPSSSQFAIDLDPEYRNVTSIELITAIIPDTNNVINEPYLLLNIKELDTLMDSPGKELSESFAMLQLAQPAAAGTFVQIDKRTFENTVLTFHTPKARLAKLTITITDCDGNVFDFGGDGTNTKPYQTTFMFKVVTLDTDRAVLQERNIYY